MSIPDQDLAPHWLYYADRAKQAHLGRADEYGHGREEQLCETLAVIERGEPFDSACQARLDRLPHNRAKKHSRMRRHLSNVHRAAAPQSNPTEPLEVRELIAQVGRVLSADQWAIEYRLAAGESYGHVAREYTIPATTLKVRVHRWRTAVRRQMGVS